MGTEQGGSPARRAWRVIVTLLAAMALTALASPGGAEGLPVIDFVSPGGVVGNEYLLNVTVVGDVAPGQVYYGVDVGDPVTPMNATQLYHYVAVIDTSGLPEGDHVVSVKAVNGTGEQVIANQTITVDHTAPEVAMTTSPPAYVLGELMVTADVEDDHVDDSRVELVIDGNLSDARSMERQGDRFELLLDSTELMCGPHQLTVQATDLAGNTATSAILDIKVDNCQPKVNFTSPHGHVMGIYRLLVEVTDPYLDAASVYAIFDGDALNRTQLELQTNDTYTYAFDTTTMVDGDHQVQVTARDMAGWSLMSEPLVLMVDNNAPTVKILTEGGNISGYLPVQAQVQDPYLDHSSVMLVVDDDEANAIWLSFAGDHWEVELDTCDLADGDRYLRVWASDEWGQVGKSSQVMLDVDNYAPSIRYTSTGGTKWGKYRVMANVTDPHLNTSCVKVQVGGATPVAMKASTDYWYYDIETTEYLNGPLNIMVMACDTRGHMNPGEMMTITVENRPDLEITAVDWARSEVEEGGTFKVQVSVRNNGYATVKGFTVVVMQGSLTLASSTEATGILPGKTHTYGLEWKAKGRGERVVHVLADPANAIAESDEANNGWQQQTINVKASSTPGFGAMVLLAALTATWVGTRRRR